MDLHVGIIGDEPGWRALLVREGIAWKNVIPPFKPGEHPALILGSHAPREVLPAVRAYLNDGGAVLVSPTHASALTGARLRRLRVTHLIPASDAALAGIDGIDVHRVIEIPERANLLAMTNGEKTAFVGREGHGHVLVLPFDAPSLLDDTHSHDRSFPSASPRLPFEHVSVIAKSALRMLALRCLEMLFHRRGLPFIHLWYYPHGASSVSFFRVDTDYGSPQEIEALSLFLRAERMSATWFVHVGAQREMLARYASMEGEEIAVHCYRHRLMTEVDATAADMELAVRMLREAGLRPAGFAAPFGRWTPATESAVRGLGLDYSSEFSLIYDDIPFRPVSGSGILQIPIHPICLGSLRRHRYTAEHAKAYFARATEQLLARRLPIGLYHHPQDGSQDVLRSVFRRLRDAGVVNLTMVQFALWWKQREQACVRGRFEEGEVSVEIDRGTDAMCVRVVHPDGKELFAANGARIPLAHAEWTAPPVAAWTTDDMRSRAFNPRIPLVRGLDAVASVLRKKERDV